MALIKIEGLISIDKEKVADAFKDVRILDEYIAVIKEAVSVDSVDLSTDKGRKDIGSRTHKVKKIKVALTNLGKDSVKELKENLISVNNGIKYIENELSEFRDETRKPLTDYENEEKRKKELRDQAIEYSINEIFFLGEIDEDDSKEGIEVLIEAIDNIDCSDGFDERAGEALKAVAQVKNKLTNALMERIKEEALEKQRQEMEKERREMAEKERERELERKSELEELEELREMKRKIQKEKEQNAVSAVCERQSQALRIEEQPKETQVMETGPSECELLDDTEVERKMYRMTTTFWSPDAYVMSDAEKEDLSTLVVRVLLSKDYECVGCNIAEEE